MAYCGKCGAVDSPGHVCGDGQPADVLENGATAAPTDAREVALAGTAPPPAEMNGGASTAQGAVVSRESLRPGDIVGEYRVDKKLGEGGMGVVFAGIHPRIGKRVAIKVLNRDLAGSAQLVSRFENEAKAVNEIGHRNIVDIFSFGTLPDGSPYFVMEWLEGQVLDEYLNEHGVLSFAHAMPIVSQVCRALIAAHNKQIVHRDLKPENIFLARDPDGAQYVKLLDFGIAKFHNEDSASHMTRTGTMMGTPYFMSPEQARGREVDHRTDIYALGVLLYRMFTGRYPFEGESFMVIVAQHLNEEPPPPSQFAESIDPQLEAIILKALVKDADARYQTVSELLAALESLPATLIPRSETSNHHTAPTAAAATGASSQPSVTDAVEAIPVSATGSVDRAQTASRAWPTKILVVIAVVGLLAVAATAALVLVLGDNKSDNAATLLRKRANMDLGRLLRLPPPQGFKRGNHFEPLPKPSLNK